nr:MAG TPA: Proteasome assembly chaperone 4 [Caudoviricetes sp.]
MAIIFDYPCFIQFYLRQLRTNNDIYIWLSGAKKLNLHHRHLLVH